MQRFVAFTADQYAVYKWLGRKFTADLHAEYKWRGTLSHKNEGAFFIGGSMVEYGFYIISDQYFVDFPDKYLKGNKQERRPHYFAIKDPKTGLYWMVPMSTRLDKYRRIMETREARKQPCDILHIAKLDNDQESVFVIQDIFPVTEKYILREYTIAENHLRVTSEKLASVVHKKAKRVLMMIRKGVRFSKTQPNVLAIERKLLGQ